jgi:molybdopterin synthase sulfur carrier subunit
MNIHLSLFGAFRQYEPGAVVNLALADDSTIADVRAALERHASTHWPDFRPGLLRVSAFASECCVLRDAEPVPADGRLAVLPPVSGG